MSTKGAGVGAGASRDGRAPLSGENLAFVATSETFTADRIFDFDGDGAGDNAIAELGEPGARHAGEPCRA